MNRTLKKRIARFAVLVLSLTLSLNLFFVEFASANESANRIGSYSAQFEDVTGKVDLSEVAQQNYNDSVIKNTSTKNEVKTVIISLSGKSMLERNTGDYTTVKDYSETAEGRLAIDEIVRDQSKFLTRLTSYNIPYEFKYSYTTIDNAVAIQTSTANVKAIKDIPGVDAVVVSNTYLEPQVETTFSSSSTAAVYNDANVYATGIYDSTSVLDRYSGNGMLVAVLDTGLDYTHPAFNEYRSDWSDEDRKYTKEEIAEIVASKNLTAESRSASTGKTLGVNDVYVSKRVPFAYDYADDDSDVYNSLNNHGTHVAGIVGGYSEQGYTDKDGKPVQGIFTGVAPNVQFFIGKVFTDNLEDKMLGGADSEDILAALEDCVNLQVDVINMSLGTSSGFTTTNDGDDEGEYMASVYDAIKQEGINLVCAASNDYSSGFNGPFGTNLSSNPDSSTVGAPSTYYPALSVASISGQLSKYILGNPGLEKNGKSLESALFYEESSDENNVKYDFAGRMLEGTSSTVAEYEYVVVPGIGRDADYTTVKNYFKDENGNSLGRIALIKRGDTTFKEKIEIAMSMGAIAVIVYNNVSGVIGMSLGELDDPVPAVSVTLDGGTALIIGAKETSDGTNDVIGKIRIDTSLEAGPFMSGFSSWGPTPDLKIKPEITAHGGEITSAVAGGYAENSGTSMASPNMAGAVALIRQYVKDVFNLSESKQDRIEITNKANQLFMSTTKIAYDETNLPYSPRKQGAGLADIDNAINKTNALIYTIDENSGNRPKLEFGDNQQGIFQGDFYVQNFGAGATPLNFNLSILLMTETLAIDGLAVAEKAHMLEGKIKWIVDNDISDAQTGAEATSVSVASGKTAKVSVIIELTDAEKKYINDNFANGMYVEGFIRLVPEESIQQTQCTVGLPFLGFYGDWTKAPMLDYSAFEITEFEKDASLLEDEKPKASVWETLPYARYHNEDYTMPMGSYLYTLPDDADPMYTEEKYLSLSCYDKYYGYDDNRNYSSMYEITYLMAGLLRNARTANYTMTNVQTGEVLKSETVNRIPKARSSGAPGFVELNLNSLTYDLPNNTQYKLDFEFELDYNGGVGSNKNTYSFTFTADYDAPVLKDADVRYYYYKDGNKTKSRIYLDLQVYDNHYAQAAILCYVEPDIDKATGEEINTLKLATEYVTPVRDAVKNGITTVSIEITDIYEEIMNEEREVPGFYVQLDDYALNSKVYYINISRSINNSMPKKISVAEGEKDITLDINEMKEVNPVYNTTVDKSEFIWTSADPDIAIVKDGQIVGKSAGETTVTVKSTASSASATYNVTVTENEKTLQNPQISFGVIKNESEVLVKAKGVVDVHPNEDIKLNVITEPWYYQELRDLPLTWTSTDPSVASVDENGNVKTLKKGIASITAKLEGTMYAANVTLNVGEEFIVRNYTLVEYHGPGGDVVIPSDKNIFYIGEKAFEDNDNIVSITFPKTVMEIRQDAFIRCTKLEEVYFIQKEPVVVDGIEVDDADLTLISYRSFYKCPNLRLVDFSNVKTITIGNDCFAECPKLSVVKEMEKLGTISSGAFRNCKSLTSVNISALNKAGGGVFSGCTGISEVITDEFTAIGDSMFSGCTNLESVVINTSKIGSYAFSGCSNLAEVTFTSTDADIGNSAFFNCKKLKKLNFNGTVRSIGNNAFSSTGLTSFTIPKGLTSMGSSVFSGTSITAIGLNDEVEIADLYSSTSPFATLVITSYIAPTNSTKYYTENGVIYNNEKTKLLLVPSIVINGFDIPSTVTEIGSNAFYGASCVKSIEGGRLHFKNSTGTTSTSLINITKIGKYAFASSSITKLVLPSTVTELGTGAFSNSQLANADLTHASITALPDSVFKGCLSLTSVEIPDTIDTYGDYAFSSTGLTSVNEKVAVLGNGVYQYSSSIVTATFTGENIVVGEKLFNGCSALKTVNFPSVAEMGDYTFISTLSLETVTFGEGTVDIGAYTFANQTVSFTKEDLNETEVFTPNPISYRTKLTTVNLPSSLKKIDEFVFYYCSELGNVNTENVESIGDYAFFNAVGVTELNMDNVKEVGVSAFDTHTADIFGDVMISYLDTINLPKAEKIGDRAFYNVKATIINIPAVKEIGELAFFGAKVTALNVPATVETIGQGAFASMQSLTAFTSDSDKFVVKSGVLYRVVEDNKFELFAYPAARVGEEEGELKVYYVEDNTFRIAAYAVSYLKKDVPVLNKVVFPYSVSTVGDYAFFKSNIREYAFESVTAPTLEAYYNEQIYTAQGGDIYSFMGNYRGYYYTNFELEYYLYDLGKQSALATPLTLYYPENGVGYTNPVYSTYFVKKTKTDTVMDDTTRDFVTRVNALESANVVSGWVDLPVNEDNTTMVANFSNTVKELRIKLNSIKDEKQLAFISASMTEALEAVENALRPVKDRFGLSALVSKLIAPTDGYVKEYVAGDVFNMAGLVITVEYDDGTTTTATGDELTLVTTKKLTTYTTFVEVSAYGKTVRIPVIVTANTQDSDSSSSSDTTSSPESIDSASVANPDGDNTALVVVGIIVAALVVLGGGGFAIYWFVIKKKNKLN